MAEITIPIADVDDAVANAKPGETVEVYATLKIKSKTDSEVVAEVSNVEKSDDMEEEEGDMEEEDSEYGSEEDSAEMSDSMPKKRGKGMGVLIMIGGPKKK